MLLDDVWLVEIIEYPTECYIYYVFQEFKRIQFYYSVRTEIVLYKPLLRDLNCTIYYYIFFRFNFKNNK